MKYIKTYEKFDLVKPDQPLSVDLRADMTNFNQSELNKKQFDKYKAKLQSIYQNYIDDQTPNENGIAQDLYNKLLSAKFIKKGNPKLKGQIIWKNPDETDETIAKENPMFKIYAEELSQERKTKKAEETLQQKQKDMAEKEQAIKNNQGDASVASKDIDNIKTDISTETDNLSKTATEVQTLKKAAKKELDDKKKELDLGKRRIEKLKGSK